MEKKDFRIAKKGDEFFIQQKNIREEWFGIVKTVWWGIPDRIILARAFDSFESAESRLEIYIDEYNGEERLKNNMTYFYFD